MEWMLMPLKRYADFSGRSRRKEYWMFMLFILIVYIAIIALSAIGGETVAGILGIVLIVFALGIFIPSLAVQVRRFHDQGKSGWFVLLNLIPIVSLAVLVFMCIDGDKGPNEYGPDPKGGADPETFE